MTDHRDMLPAFGFKMMRETTYSMADISPSSTTKRGRRRPEAIFRAHTHTWTHTHLSVDDHSWRAGVLPFTALLMTYRVVISLQGNEEIIYSNKAHLRSFLLYVSDQHVADLQHGRRLSVSDRHPGGAVWFPQPAAAPLWWDTSCVSTAVLGLSIDWWDVHKAKSPASW